ncbi:reticulon-1 isoform X2 [Drosophila hydei]|uniref:Reticulon-like protein n=1 Tax=Drosophila hydei TaxID=7224 RepID=A0A6J1ME91_DROHY|nr:reticulon-1 isoform X2 [Drosophila hydei]
MDFNFADLKKEAANTAEDIFNAASKQVSTTYDDLLGDVNASSGGVNVSGEGVQDDNAHTEKYFANEQKNLDFGDPQAFVQRMSAGAKEAQEQLDAKFAQKADDFGDFLKESAKEVKQNIGELTSDFMNVERGMFGDASKAAAPSAAAPAVAHAAAPVPVAAAVPAAKPVQDQEADLLGFKPMNSAPLQPFEPTAPTAHDQFYDDDDDDFLIKPTPAAAVVAPAAPAVANTESDTDSPSVSYTPSPAKKPIADALKEQDNEKFISSEDLLSDFKDVPASAAVPAPAAVPFPSSTPAPALITDLDDDEFVVKPASKVEPAKVEPPKVEPPKVEPPKVVPPKVEPPKVEPVKPEPAKQPQPPKQQQQQQQHPKIVSVEEIFYKYGLVESLIYWRDVKKSGIVFGAGLITLVAISCFSVISVFAYLSLLTLVGTVAFRIYKSVTQAVQKTNDGHPFKEYLELDLTLSQEKVQHIAGVAVAHINGFTAELRRLFLVEDIIDSIKFGVILWVFTYIGAWFNGMTLVILAFVSLFTLPKVYENNKQSIDTYLDLVRNKLTEITDKIRVALPIGNKKPVAAAESEKDK